MLTYDLSIIVATARSANLVRVLDYIEQQSVAGLAVEIIIIQEAMDERDHRKFNLDTKLPVNDLVVKMQQLHGDYGAAARDVGITEAKGEYLVFWDDDNIYYQHALVSQYSAAQGFDIGIVRTKHQNLIIPTANNIKAGDIDTMCLCVKRELAARERWATNGGRYSDYRWLSKLLKHNPIVNYSKVIIGHHL